MFYQFLSYSDCSINVRIAWIMPSWSVTLSLTFILVVHYRPNDSGSNSKWYKRTFTLVGGWISGDDGTGEKAKNQTSFKQFKTIWKPFIFWSLRLCYGIYKFRELMDEININSTELWVWITYNRSWHRCTGRGAERGVLWAPGENWANFF